MAKDPYIVLGVPRDADDATIRGAYRRLAKNYHPDLHPDDPVAAQKMNELNAAYDAIRSPAARQRHAQPDAYARPSGGQTESRRYDAPNGDDVWEEIFRQAEQRQRNERPQGRIRFGRLILTALLGYLLLSFLSGGCARLLGGYGAYGTGDYGGGFEFPLEGYQTAPFFSDSQEE